MRTALTLFSTSLVLFAACGDDDDPKKDTTTATDTGNDTADTAVQSETSDETDTGLVTQATDAVDDTDGSTEPPPDYFPDPTSAPSRSVSIPGLTDAVRVIYDDRGIPHIFGKNESDLLIVQGYITAKDRLFQMHTLRSASKGRLAEFAGNGSLSGDFFLRLLKLGRTAERMAEWSEDNDPLVWKAMTDFATGVNAYLAAMRAGNEPRPIEVSLFGDGIVYDWTPADTMAIVRLQTWDLGFGGVIDELTIWTQMQAMKAEFGGTNRDGLWLDLARFEPAAETATLEPDGGASQAGAFDLAEALADDFYGFGSKKRREWTEEVKRGFEDMKKIPHHAFRGADGEGWGSNNWVVGGAHTASGKVIVSNDTHLSLRNPAIFYQVHLSNTLAGGAFNSEGVIFAGAPGIVLGHNDHAAWGGTVFYSDVTDMYLETLDATKSTVLYDGEQVALEERVETFRFAPPATGPCVDVAPAWVKNLTFTEEKTDTRCTLTVTFLDVPHHGPIVPWSISENDDGTFSAMAFKWTGFEPTDEMGAVYRLNTVADFDDFKAALDRFGVGAQNWIYGDTAGDIGWYPSHLVPIRKHIAAGNLDYPPFLPMPGHTSDTNWDGFVPRAELPQAHNPAKGFLITANADPIGVSFDNDPFNDGPYIGYAWDLGYRVDQITQRIEGLIDSDTAITREHLKSIQADHKSRLGADLVPGILAALDAAKTNADPTAAPFATAEVIAAGELLAKWGAELDYQAASGVGATDGSDEAEAAAATAIFNAFLPFFITNTLSDEGLHQASSSLLGRILRRLYVAPETMATWDADNQVSPLWDDARTTEVTETKAYMIVKSLSEAVAFLSNPDKVGVPDQGGFGTSDMTKWRWGALHTVTLRHNVAPAFNIPPPSGPHPHGFPRHGDNFVVDASNPGLTDTNFTFASGAAIRNHYEMKVPVEFDGVIPGGQSEDVNSPHYSDEAMLWAENLSPKVAFTVSDIIAAKRTIVDFTAP